MCGKLNLLSPRHWHATARAMWRLLFREINCILNQRTFKSRFQSCPGSDRRTKSCLNVSRIFRRCFNEWRIPVFRAPGSCLLRRDFLISFSYVNLRQKYFQLLFVDRKLKIFFPLVADALCYQLRWTETLSLPEHPHSTETLISRELNF